MKSATATISPDLVFRAFSDRTRLRILNMLQGGGGGEICVCDLVRVIDAPQPKISRHLAYLRRSGLVKARKDGLWMHYRLAKPAKSEEEALSHYRRVRDQIKTWIQTLPQSLSVH